MASMVIHGKLHHRTPSWVPASARFHVRIRIEGEQRALTDPAVAPALLTSVDFYHARERWHAWLFLLMPDHIHAVLSFFDTSTMSRVIGDWKRYHETQTDVVWQEGYFDHRLRHEDEVVKKCHYIRMNPVRAGLCDVLADWAWVVEPWRREGAG
ncbi:MAG: hypothetical protein K8T26_18135 [Lentisphaerae bacterium]|nr:hypothetical protein [Lentisphaerota bacterium]